MGFGGDVDLGLSGLRSVYATAVKLLRFHHAHIVHDAFDLISHGFGWLIGYALHYTL